MEHLLLKAATTATEEGVFEAVISTATIDRDGDIVEPSAMVDALAKWVKVGKLVPLAWAHGEEVVGHIDPSTARAMGNEVTATGKVDLSDARGKEAWRLVKSGTLSFSFGYLIPEGGAVKRAGSARGLHITQLDVFEISVVPVGPANNDTRVLSWKTAEALRKRAEQVEREAEEDALPNVPEAPPAPPEPTFEEKILQELQEVKSTLADTRQELEDLKKKQAEETGKGTKSRSVDPLREQADHLALEFASGGESLRKPPAKVAPPPPNLLPIKELRQRMRDEMLQALSGEPTHE